MGLAYLPDGKVIDYKEYLKHPHWQKVRKARFDFDNHQCVICHKDLDGEIYNTHHIHYYRCGHERIRDVMTLCKTCHEEFHQSWQKSQFWKGKEKGHWEIFNLEHTAKLCQYYWKRDRLISKNPDDPNLCNKDTARQILDDYFRVFAFTKPPIIDPYDLTLFVRNKRYELFFAAEEKGMTVEEFLDDYYGPKVRGKNPIRQEAGRKNGCFDHTPASFHRHYSENQNINLLMELVKRLEQED